MALPTQVRILLPPLCPPLLATAFERLSRVWGQVRGVRGMVEEDRYCIDVLTQISAVQAALDKVALGLLDEHARHCVAGAVEGERVDMTDELMAAVGRLMRRG